MKKNCFNAVYEVVSLIPKGRVTSYGAIAKYLRLNARTVGWAMYAAEDKPWLPAHRVVNHKGILTASKFFTFDSMEKLLKDEGIEVIENRVKNFKKVFWNPAEEIKKTPKNISYKK